MMKHNDYEGLMVPIALRFSVIEKNSIGGARRLKVKRNA